MDPERFPDELARLPDNAQEMARKGMGPVYTHTSDGRRLRHEGFCDSDRHKIMKRFYRPYATAMMGQVSLLLDRFGRCLIIDGHSFPSLPPPFEDASLRRPHVCIGYEDYHAPKELVRELKAICLARGLAVAHNEPFSGSYVPLPFYRRSRAVRSVMTEINRASYMDESTQASGRRNSRRPGTWLGASWSGRPRAFREVRTRPSLLVKSAGPHRCLAADRATSRRKGAAVQSKIAAGNLKGKAVGSTAPRVS